MNDNFLKVAKKAAIEAGKIIQKYSGKVHQKKIKNKDTSNFVTEADLEAEKMIITTLSRDFSSHNIITEEQENIQKGSDYTWVIDPLDGSFAFVHGIPYFAVSIGLLKNNKPILGVVNHIPEERLYWAKDKEGSYMNGQTLQVSTKKILSDAACVLNFDHRVGRQQKFDLYVAPLMNKIGYLYSLGSAAATMSILSKGILDGYVAQAWLWDFVAGTVIVREAGGKVTDFEGNEPDWISERLNIVASNGLIHDQILEALRE